jgi:xanthine dehydrogenase YagT iron-sulfur-binding subunit
LVLAGQAEGREVVTVEGVADGDELDPVQRAFVEAGAVQCGFCTPGQICSAVALLQEAKNGELSYASTDFRQKPHSLTLSDDELRERMSGNLCRCGAYNGIVDAILDVARSGAP